MGKRTLGEVGSVSLLSGISSVFTSKRREYGTPDREDKCRIAWVLVSKFEAACLFPRIIAAVWLYLAHDRFALMQRALYLRARDIHRRWHYTFSVWPLLRTDKPHIARAGAEW